jgi:uncharacterized membrane protein
MAVTVDYDRAALDVESLKHATGKAARLDSVDFVRGLVMVIMALDHVRDYFSQGGFGDGRFDPTDLSATIPGYFFTRWVTHYCAPTFVFLAGTGAFLAGSRGKTRGQLSWFLLSRGLWLALLEVTLVHISWQFNLDLHDRGGAVIWAIGWSMVGLSILVWLPTSAVAAIGVAIIAFHNLLDTLIVESIGGFGWIWGLVHQPMQIGLHLENWPSISWAPVSESEPFNGSSDFRFATPYVILPWLGVMSAGYGLGAMFLLDQPTRRRQLLGLGIVLTLLFVGLRYYNQYGDPQKYTEPPVRELTMFGREWDAEQSKPMMRLMAFLNCTKYPPSLLFLLMTLGPAITALALFDRPLGWFLRPFVIFGRVPLFFYLLHLPLIHGLAVAIDFHRFGYSPLAHQSFFVPPTVPIPEGYGLDLVKVYAVWIGVVVFLFPFCYAFSRLKRRYPGGILSYL